MKSLLTTLTTIMAFGLLTVSMPVFAQTPDEKAPVDIAVCDPLMEHGVTQNRTLANHNKEKQGGDSGIPCVSIHESGNETVAIGGIMRDGVDIPGMVCNRPSI